MTFQEGESSEVEKPGELDNGTLLGHRDGSNHLPNDSSENCSIAPGLSPKREEFKGSISNEDAGSLKNTKNCDDVDTKSTAFTTSESKRRRSASESDSMDIDLMPLRTRLSNKHTLKKPKTKSSDETTSEGKGTDSITDSTEADSIHLRSRMSKKNALKKPKTAFDNEAANRRKETDLFSESDSTDVDSVPLCAQMSRKSTRKKPKIASVDETTDKRKGEDSIGDSTDVDSVPVYSRLSKKNTLKKPKTASGSESTDKRMETDSIAVRIGDDNDFESPKAGRSAAGKRKGSELSDDHDLLTSVFLTDSQTSSTSNREAKAGLNSKKRKTKKADSTVDISKRKVVKPAKKRITKRAVKSADKPTAEVLEGKD